MQCSVLVIGYGNPGRLDDGLGPACADAIMALDLPGVMVDSNYQLAVEDAEAVSKHDIVVFADASVSGDEPFGFFELEPQRELSFTSHSVEPAAVLAMAHQMFDSKVRGFALAIRGYEFNDFGETLSERAAGNLAAAVEFLASTIRKGSFPQPDPVTTDPKAPEVSLTIAQADLN